MLPTQAGLTAGDISEFTETGRIAARPLTFFSGPRDVFPFTFAGQPVGLACLVADPGDTPKSIFVSGFDSHPLAPNVAFTLQDSLEYFKSGMDVLKKLTEGEVHLNTNGSDDQLPAQNVQENKFTGPHPAGNVGVQIHHIDPIAKGDLVWTVSPYGVAQIGKLFIEEPFCN